MEKKEKIMILRIVITAALCLMAELLPMAGATKAVIYTAAFLITGADIIFKAIGCLIKGEILDENTLMSIACICAIALGNYAEAVAVAVFFQVGELVLDMAVDKSRRSVEALVSLMPETAVVIENGVERTVSAKSVKVGQTILLKAGERVPLDGVVVEGAALADTAAITGESRPTYLSVGDNVLAGSIVSDANIKVEVINELADSTVSRMLDIMENASAKKAKTERFITKFARYYTPGIVFAAVLLTVIPSLFTGEWTKWLYRSMTFMVVSCPCALVISVPLGFFAGIGAASRKGILLKGGNSIEALAKVDTAVFDKTGTLTNGEFFVSGVYPSNGISGDTLIRIAAAAEAYSNHPIAKCIAKQWDAGKIEISDVKELAGMGVTAKINGKTVLVGNTKLMGQNGIEAENNGGVHVAAGNTYLGYITVADKLKQNVENIGEYLHREDIDDIFVLTGDNAENTRHIESIKGMTKVYAGLLPAQKVEMLQKIKSQNKKVVFVGDGINDAPVIASADVGASMGLASDAARETADMVLLNDSPLSVAAAKHIAKRTLGIVKQNVAFCLAVKALVLITGAFGLAGMWAAVAADVGVSLLASLNALRTLFIR